ncbi:MAG: hypothetical protein RBS57_04685 [Desulforhabdus sp.]|nr:hypothetical protein [Desulforhabdus sp.]
MRLHTISNDLIQYIDGIFREEFGNDIVDVIDCSLIPHEALLQIRVKHASADIRSFAQAVSREFAELGRQVTIQVTN